ncbi:MAG: hypothetical protein QW478_11255 [Candidatus Micrarchaeaceae archaeon]
MNRKNNRCVICGRKALKGALYCSGYCAKISLMLKLDVEDDTS